MTNPSFHDFLRLSLAAIERELPSGYEKLVALLGRRCTRVDVDRESVWLVPQSTGLYVWTSPIEHLVEARFSRGVLRELLQGRVSLLDAIVQSRFELKGAAADLAAFDDALTTYLACGVRCSALPNLLQQFLESA